MKAYLMLLLLPLMFSGCISTPRYQLNMSASELSNRIESTGNSTSTVNVQAQQTNYHSNVSVSGGYYSEFNDGGRSFGQGGFANNRIAIARRSTLNLGVNNYNVYAGYEFSFTGGDDVHQFRVALHGNDVDFQTAGTDGFNSPLLFGIDIDVHKIFQQNDLDFLWGARLTSTMLTYNFNSSVNINGDIYDADSLGVFGVGMPMGVQMDVGSFTLEAIATPTAYFHSWNTELGFENDIAFTNFNVPISAGFGFNW